MYHHSCLSIILDACEQTEKERAQRQETVETGKPGPGVIKLFSCSTQLSTKFQLLKKTKILTNEEVSCFKSLICCIYHVNKC